jgi:7-cyano-7-deazaguanine synthase
VSAKAGEREERMKTVVLLSGGLDSTVLLAHVVRRLGDPAIALSVAYGQRHEVELASARKVAEYFRCDYREVDLGEALEPVFANAKSSQVGKMVDVPQGHYASEPMKLTIVPNRNMLLLAIAGALAESEAAFTIAYAAHAGDHPIYPDCRPPFITAMENAIDYATGGRVAVLAPFRHWTKTKIVQHGQELGAPFSLTWSCYDPQPSPLKEKWPLVMHCGLCGTCVERREAFTAAKVPDPTVYAIAESEPRSEGTPDVP